MGTTHPTDRTQSIDPLDPAVMDKIVRGEHGAPFDVLGPHDLTIEGEKVQVIRAFLPGAHAAWVIRLADTPDPQAPKPPVRAAMRRLHPEGFFSVLIEGAYESYLLEAEYENGAHRRVHDPYAFKPLLSAFDLHLLGEGTMEQAYERLGAHPQVVDGIAGVAFGVWAPNAQRVSVVGDFNGWDERVLPMRLRSGGIWELFVPDLPVGTLYKYAVLSWNAGYRALKADPYAFAAEVRPGTASRVWSLDEYSWSDEEWMTRRTASDPLTAPMTIYELHVGSWRSDPDTQAPSAVTYRGLAHQLVPYLQNLGYTHVELMPIAEFPFDGSWGYQVTGYFAPTSRYGTPQDFMYFVDYCHQHGIGVLLDWVPAHFPKDEHGLNYFDGSHLYEHADPRLGEHPDWGTLVFNYGRPEVRNFLLSNALFWLDKYHVDGLRVDAVASMLYLDYSRKAGEWLPNKYGGRENLDAVTFLRRFNELVHGRFPGAVTVAEESTSWPLVSRPVYIGGLGFTFKWNMGWMHDILHFMSLDPIHRRYHHNELTFSMIYAFTENFILPFSHDEIVHLKGSMLNKMPGDVWQKFANLRSLYAFMYGHPGKKLLFMGDEFGQWAEWNYAGWLDWFLLGPAGDHPSLHAQLQGLVRDLNELLRHSPALYEVDFSPAGFDWIDCNDADNSIVSFVRYSADRQECLLFVCNFTPVPRQGYRVGVPAPAYYAEILNTDSAMYGGSNLGNLGGVASEPIATHGRPDSITLTLPPLAVVVFRPVPATLPVTVARAAEQQATASPAQPERPAPPAAPERAPATVPDDPPDDPPDLAAGTGAARKAPRSGSKRGNSASGRSGAHGRAIEGPQRPGVHQAGIADSAVPRQRR
jgi:1,4-alpha-glucan branching enzyme